MFLTSRVKCKIEKPDEKEIAEREGKKNPRENSRDEGDLGSEIDRFSGRLLFFSFFPGDSFNFEFLFNTHHFCDC